MHKYEISFTKTIIDSPIQFGEVIVKANDIDEACQKFALGINFDAHIIRISDKGLWS